MIKKMILGTMETNCYIVVNDDTKECFIVDPATNGQKIVKYLNENELTLKAILLTHGHFDHIGAVDYLTDRCPCDVYTHEYTKDLLTDTGLNLSDMIFPFVVKSEVQNAPESFELCGFKIQWLLLEGHCQGSSMIYLPEEKVIFSGDVLFAGSIGRFDFPTSSNLKTKETLKTIKEYDFDAVIYPGHGESSSLSYEQQNNPYLNV